MIDVPWKRRVNANSHAALPAACINEATPVYPSGRAAARLTAVVVFRLNLSEFAIFCQ